MFIYEKETNNEPQAILQQLSKKRRIASLDEEKQKIIESVASRVNSIKSPTKLQIVKKIVASISPTLNAAEKNKLDFPTTVVTHPHNSKIPAQRRLWSTKKRKSQSTDCLKKPSESEMNNMAVTFLLK